MNAHASSGIVIELRPRPRCSTSTSGSTGPCNAATHAPGAKQPDTPRSATAMVRQAAPDAVFLAVVEGVLEAVVADWALGADAFGVGAHSLAKSYDRMERGA